MRGDHLLRIETGLRAMARVDITQELSAILEKLAPEQMLECLIGTGGDT